MLRWGVSLSLSLSLSLASLGARAQSTSDCDAATFSPRLQYSEEQDHFDYRLNILGTTPTISSADITRTVIAAADEWNETSGAATLTYRGTTTKTAADYGVLNLAQCEAAGLTFSTIIVHANENRPAGFPVAQNVSRCEYTGQPPEAQGHYQFTIELYLHDTDGSLDFDVGDPSIFLEDLLGVVVHELGHSFNFDDNPTLSYASLMNYPTALGERIGHRYRTPYPFDVNCAFRNRQPMRVHRIQRSCAGSVCAWSNPVAMTAATEAYLTGGGGGRVVSGIFSIRWLGAHGFDPDSENMVGTTGSLGNVALATTEPLFVPRAMLGLWRDRDAARQRFLFVPATQPAADDEEDEFRISQRTSTNDFVTGSAVSVLSRCTSMTAWMVCGGQQDVRAARAPSVAWAPGAFTYNPSGVALTAWAEQDRADVAKDGEVFIAISSVGENTLPKPNTAGVRSAIAPQVACRNAATSRRCVVVYAEQNPSYAVMAKRFDISVLNEFDPIDFRFEDHRYQTNFVGSAVAVTGLTSSRMALFYSTAESKYFLVIRTQNPGQATQVYTSSDGAAWTQGTDIATFLDVGPYAPGYQVSSSNNLFILAP